MKTLRNFFLFAVLASVALVSCKKEKDADLIIGKWEATSMSYSVFMNDELVESDTESFESGEMVITFHKDGKYNVIFNDDVFGSDEEHGTYSIDGNKLIIDGETGEFSINNNTLTILTSESENNDGDTYMYESTLKLKKIN